MQDVISTSAALLAFHRPNDVRDRGKGLAGHEIWRKIKLGGSVGRRRP